ncbi:MAG: plasmid maintenance system killer protein [Alcanivorax sp.]|nr:plasmid maintenance system killer protein [Alcanivorax sp.]
MIESFGNRVTEDLYHGASSARVRRLPPEIRMSALYKLDVLNAVGSLDELRSPPGNRLEALRGDYAGFHSIRINAQWRLVFRWKARGAHEVAIVDYH